MTKQNPHGVNLFLSSPMMIRSMVPHFENNSCICSSVVKWVKFPTYTVFSCNALVMLSKLPLLMALRIKYCDGLSNRSAELVYVSSRISMVGFK